MSQVLQGLVEVFRFAYSGGSRSSVYVSLLPLLLLLCYYYYYYYSDLCLDVYWMASSSELSPCPYLLLISDINMSANHNVRPLGTGADANAASTRTPAVKY